MQYQTVVFHHHQNTRFFAFPSLWGRPQKLVRLWDCITEMQRSHLASRWERQAELELCYTVVIGKVLHFRAARCRERRWKTGILSRQQNACIYAKHNLEVVSSYWLEVLFWQRKQKEKHWTTSVPALPLLPCTLLRPAQHPAVQLAQLKFICWRKGGEMEYKILRKESAVIQSSSRNTRWWIFLWEAQCFGRKSRDSSDLNLTPDHR